jgi:endoglucanase
VTRGAFSGARAAVSVVAVVLAVGCAGGGATRAAAVRATAATPGVCGATGTATSTPAQTRIPLQESGAVLFRVNQVGYVAGCPKLAFVMTHGPAGTRAFSLLSGRGRVVLRGNASGPQRWSTRYDVYQLDFSAVHAPGVYVLRFAGHASPPLRIGDAAALYRPLAGDALAFLQSQRDGAGVISGPMHRRPSHLDDATASVYAIPHYNAAGLLTGGLKPTGGTVDAEGGWFDAGDYLKFVTTASFTDSVLLFTARQFPTGMPQLGALLAEARHGTDWLEQMWNQTTRVLYFQVGIGDGNGGSILGDHDIWRLPQADDSSARSPSNPAHFAAHRPVFAANAPGQPISPNLAGGVAAAFGLCAQVFATSDPAYAARCLLDGQVIYDQANLAPRGALVTAVPFSYYPEIEWRADMEFAAVELYLATQQLGSQVPGLPHPAPAYYLIAASQLANDYMVEPTDGEESFTLYDVSTLADFDLVRILGTAAAQPLLDANQLETGVATVMSDRHDQLALAAHLASQNPFAEANPATNQDTVAHAFGYATQSTLYDALAGRPTFEALGQTQLDWALGANAWGSSFMVGAGSVFPHCLANQIPNLSGSLTGSGAILKGATVDGPVAPSDVTGLSSIGGSRACPAGGATDPFAAQDAHGFAYRDDVRSFATSEASDDVAALALLAAAAEAARG